MSFASTLDVLRPTLPCYLAVAKYCLLRESGAASRGGQQATVTRAGRERLAMVSTVPSTLHGVSP